MQSGRPVPRHPALGEPARAPTSWPTRRTRTSAPARSRSLTSDDAGVAGPGHRRRGRRPRGPGSTHTPMSLVHATIEPGARLDLPWHVDFNALVYVLAGSGTVGVDAPADPDRASPRCSAAATSSRSPPPRSRRAARPTLEVIVVGGRPIREPLAWAGPFVMNTKAEVHAGVRGLPAGPLRHIPACTVRRRRAGGCRHGEVRRLDASTRIRSAAVSWGERRDLNPRHPRPQRGALPAELRPPCESADVAALGRTPEEPERQCSRSRRAAPRRNPGAPWTSVTSRRRGR